jgi:catechol 2,3-dioxygenase-like lactoylglutathione lyase family enzyme
VLQNSDLIAFAPTTDPARARRFYGETLGLALVAHTEFALVFDAHGTMLRISDVHELAPAEHTILGWRVSDIVETVRGLAKAGVAFASYPWLNQDQLGVWTSPDGSRVAWFKDPDGNTLSLTQFPE